MENKSEKISVLMSVYNKEIPYYLKTALESIINQTYKPSEIVLVEDGMLTVELYDVIDSFETLEGIDFKRVKLSENQGLGKALNVGLEYCSNEIIARMDTDDISSIERFEKQVRLLLSNNIDVLSSDIEEYNHDLTSKIGERRLPSEQNEIEKMSKMRSPINHPAVMFKKSVVLSVGGYPLIRNQQDYMLWILLLNKGCKFSNINENLLVMRSGDELLKRRRGKKYRLIDKLIAKEAKSIGYFSRSQYIKFRIYRYLLRILPFFIMKKIYKSKR